MLLYAATIFVSAFLLFQVQPVIAKMILPWFGGSAGVWTTCMLFFQTALLLGYLYAHWTIRSLKPRAQVMVHTALLVAAALALPILPNPSWKPAGSEEPTLRILGLLAVTIGLPYLALSTTGPLLQAWFARDPRRAGRPPYRLYALSNVGSMLALLSYPVAVEPWLTGRAQAFLWSAGFGLFALLCGATAWRGGRAAITESAAHDDPPAERIGWGLLWLWTGLAACASSLLLAVTNHLCTNVAAIPFLWIVPLALYLLTFILCFDGDGWYRRPVFLPLLAAALASMAWAVHASSDTVPLRIGVPLFSVGLFVCCMVCHGELARLKPDPRHLTAFFLTVSIGGALGGLFVGVVAPQLFPGYFELPLTLVFCAALVLVVAWRDPGSIFYQAGLDAGWLLTILGVCAFAGYTFYRMHETRGGARVAVRNFYGGLRVRDDGKGEEAARSLTHGTINHGEEYTAPDKRMKPLTYYAPSSGVGLALTQRPHLGPRHVGVIGLGTGTLAAYGEPGDRFRFYEINPLVIELANREFYYTHGSKAKVDFVLGDARLSLEREAPQNFDVLAVDAFSSDAIPVHLLTAEAFRLYFRHLKPDGILAVHVSNKYLNLKPIVATAAAAFGKEAREVDTDDDETDSAVFGATWILVTADKAFFATPKLTVVGTRLTHRTDLPMWTDDFSNLYRILK